MPDPTRISVFKELSCPSGGYVSGEDLCFKLKVSRTAIWKAIASLRHDGYNIESTPGRGYKLISTPSDLTYEKACVELGKYGRWSVYYYKSIDSTNEAAKKMARGTANHGDIVIADRQTLGKGRMGRRWESPGGVGLWFSIILRPNYLPLIYASRLVPTVALGIVDAIFETLSIKARIKWPNDIYVGGKKVCGILTEVGAEVDKISYAVVGIGINVNTDNNDFPSSIRKTATSLKECFGSEIDRSAFFAVVVKNIMKWLEILENNEWGHILEEFKMQSYTLNKPICFSSPGGNSFKGIARDIDEDGSLIVLCDDGEIRKVYTGDVNLISPGNLI